jgi:hypothetical protein
MGSVRAVPPDANVLIAPAANPTEKIMNRYILSSEQVHLFWKSKYHFKALFGILI